MKESEIRKFILSASEQFSRSKQRVLKKINKHQFVEQNKEAMLEMLDVLYHAEEKRV